MQFTAGGDKTHLVSVEGAFGRDVSFAMRMKLRGSPAATEAHYGLGDQSERIQPVWAAEPHQMNGDSPVDRLTNAFSKEVENQEHVPAIRFTSCSFYPIRQRIKSQQSLVVL